MRKAVIFDLDDTLYLERRFALSGFAAVAEELERRYGIPRRRVFRTLASAMRAGRRATALQILCARFGLPEQLVPELVLQIRRHVPSLRLPAASRRVLVALRQDWRLGLLTNGTPSVQLHKIEALGLAPLVDSVVFAMEHGSGEGKPDPTVFEEASRQLGVTTRRCVFVGDDPGRDIAGARSVGMATIHICRRESSDGATGGTDADAVVASIADVPDAAGALLQRVVAHAH